MGYVRDDGARAHNLSQGICTKNLANQGKQEATGIDAPARTSVSRNKAGMPPFALLFEEKYPINRTQTARVHTSKRGVRN